MKIQLLICALVLSTVLSAPTGVVFEDKDLIENAVKTAKEDLKKLEEQYAQAVKEKADVETQLSLKRDIKRQKNEVRDREVRIKDKIQLAHIKAKITRIEAKITAEKAKPKPDNNRLTRLAKRREWWILKQEKTRIKEQQRLAKRVQCHKKDQQRYEARVQFCKTHLTATGCTFFLEKYNKANNIILQSRQNERKVETKIETSRQEHINTFANNKDIDAKKVLIEHRFHIKMDMARKKIDMLEAKLKELSAKPLDERLKNTEIRIQESIDKLKKVIEGAKLEKDKTAVLRSSGPGECSTCDLKILELLNRIYTVIVKEDEIKYKEEDVVRQRKVMKTRTVKVPTSTVVTKTRMVPKQVTKTVRVQKQVPHTVTEYVMKEREWFTDEKVNKTNYKWVDEKVLQTKYRDVVKTVEFEDTKIVDEKVQVKKERKVRVQELIEVAPGKTEWKDMGTYETREYTEWEVQKRPVKFTNTKQVPQKEAYQDWVTVKKWTPFTEVVIEKKRHVANEKVPVTKTEMKLEWVNEVKTVTEMVPETYTETVQGTQDKQEQYEDVENYTEKVKTALPRTYSSRIQTIEKTGPIEIKETIIPQTRERRELPGNRN